MLPPTVSIIMPTRGSGASLRLSPLLYPDRGHAECPVYRPTMQMQVRVLMAAAAIASGHGRWVLRRPGPADGVGSGGTRGRYILMGDACEV